MTRKEALAELITKVEAGEATYPHGWTFYDVFPHDKNFARVQDSYNGSLDAAKELHEAVLPGWRYMITHGPSGDTVVVAERLGVDVDTIGVALDNPARAWLLAILKALHSMEKD